MVKNEWNLDFVTVKANKSEKADLRASIFGSKVGPTGRDGILATSLQSPSAVDITIVDSVIEGAGQMNVEGTALNFPPDAAQAQNKGKVNVSIKRSVIRSANASSNLNGAGLNIWLGPSGGIDELPQAIADYQLTVIDSRIENAEQAALFVSMKGLKDKGTYKVKLRGNTIVDNGQTEIAVFAPDAQIDARKNCWGAPEGLNFDRVALFGQNRNQLDASEPLDCTPIGLD